MTAFLAIEPNWAIDQVADTTRADERFARVADKPAQNHPGRNVALQLCRQSTTDSVSVFQD